MTASLAFYLVAALALAAGLLRLVRARSSTNPPAARCYGLILFALAVSFSTMAASTQALINAYVLDGGKLVGNLCTLVAAFGAVAATLYTRWPPEQASPRVRRRAAGLGAAAVVLVVTFFWPHPVPLTGSFDGLYAIDPSLALYTTAYALYVGFCLGDFTRLCATFSAHAPRFLRWGLRVLTLGGALGVAYAAAKLGIVVHRVITGSRAAPGDAQGVCHGAFSSFGCTVVVGGPALVVLLAVTGVLLCAGASRLEDLAEFTATMRTDRRLQPLWQAITHAVPQVLPEKTPADNDDPGAVERMRRRLARRYVEIRDGLLLLAPHRPQAHEGAETDPEREAAAIAAAIAAKQAEHPPVREVPAAPLATLDHDPDRGADTAWLQQVAIAFTRLGGTATQPVEAR